MRGAYDAVMASLFAEVPESLATILVDDGVAARPRARRSNADLIVNGLTGAAVIVTLLQTPDTIRRFAELLVSLWREEVPVADTVDGQIIVQTRHERVVLSLDPEADARTIAARLEEALER